MSEIATPATAATPPATTAAPAPNAGAKPEVGQNPAAAETAKPAAAAAPELFEVKIDGKTVKMTREELVQAASLGSAAQKRFTEAAQLKKQAEGLLSRMRDPKKAIALLQDPELGLNQNEVRAAFEDWYATTFIAREQMTEEQRELADARARIKKYEDEDAAKTQREQQEAEEKLDLQTQETLQREIIDVIESSGLPKTKFTGSRVAYWMRLNETRKLNAPREMIVEQVRKETRDIMNSLVESSDGDVLMNLLGESTVKKIRKFDLDRLRAKRGQLAGTAPGAVAAPAPKEPRQKLRSSDVNRRLRDLRMGRLK